MILSVACFDVNVGAVCTFYVSQIMSLGKNGPLTLYYQSIGFYSFSIYVFRAHHAIMFL